MELLTTLYRDYAYVIDNFFHTVTGWSSVPAHAAPEVKYVNAVSSNPFSGDVHVANSSS